MRHIKKVSIIIFVLIYIMMPNVIASTKAQAGIEATLVTDKEEYIENDKIITTVTIKNTNDKTVNNIIIENLAPQGYKLLEENNKTKQINTLKKGETTSFAITYVKSDNKGSEQKPVVLKPMSSISPKTGDTINIVLLATLMLISAIGIVSILLVGKRKKKSISTICLCFAILCTSIICKPAGVRASESYITKSFEVTKNVKIDGKEAIFKVKISYQLDNPQIPEGSTNIELNDDNLYFDSEANRYYIIDPSINFIKGRIIGNISNVSSMEYQICDNQDTSIKSGNIEVAEAWRIDNIGLIIGENNIYVKTILKNGEAIERKFVIGNSSSNYINNLTIDREDNDKDGLINYLEDYYKTDKNNPDTDGDGLSDYIEISVLGTDPLKADTNDNGISDAYEDKDGDGLNNITEIKIGTDPAYSDTDGDGLSDNEEINIYKTNPLVQDTDGDGATDGWEVENGYDPLVKNDSFKIRQNLADGKVTAAVELNVTGERAELLTISQVEDEAFLNNKIPGYIGSAYDFSLAGNEFDTAVMSFTFDKELLNNEEFVPTIYYFNEETQLLEELETTVEGNVAHATVTHFSKYILLNKTEFDSVWDKDIKPPDYEASQEDLALDIAFVIDYSASMEDNDPNQLCKQLSKQFVSKLRDGRDKAAVIEFIRVATILSSLTTNKEEIINAIDNIIYDNGWSWDSGTDGSTGIRAALEELSQSEAKYKYIIFLTDGEDNGYTYSYDDLIAEAIEKNIPIYAIGLGDANIGVLQNIANQTKGKYYYASANSTAEDILKLEEVFDKIQSETIDYSKDSNSDGISDYYTKLLCEGRIRSGAGVPLFEGKTYEEVQKAGADFDNDGLKNGEEVKIYQNNGKIYAKVFSSPVEKDTDQDGILDGDDQNPLEWDVGARDLAIFAALAYEDAGNLKGKMFNLSTQKEEHHFTKGASLKSIDKGIAEKWRILDFEETLADFDTKLSVTTFKNGNNIVIAYRGTNGEIGEWANNVLRVGVLNYHVEERAAKKYALKIAKYFSKHKIYITGHSLGGYLAQVGGAEMLRQNAAVPEGVMYFNGFGQNIGLLKVFPSNITPNKTEDTYDILKSYAKSHNLISYEIKGDVVSSLGTHAGKRIGLYVANEPRKRHANYKQDFAFDAIFFAADKMGMPVKYYYNHYKSKTTKEYINMTHETNSFYYNLKQGIRG